MSDNCCTPKTASKCPIKCNFAGTLIKYLILAAALITSANLIQKGLIKFRSYDRIVTVKGLSTKDVEADIATWPIKHVVTGDDLPALQTLLEKNSNQITSFLISKGVKKSDIISKTTNVYDKVAQAYGEPNVETNRYILSETIVVTTTNINAIDHASENAGDLIKDGITIVRDIDPMGPGNPAYIYTRLNDIKPAMISEATNSARKSAEQFAIDSGARIGRIAQADQGMFVILPRNSDNGFMERAERLKTVRVVSTLKFFID